MSTRKRTLTYFLLGFALFGVEFMPVRAPAGPAGGQQPTDQKPVGTSQVIKSESQLVLVDVVVTDKKGHYLTDLESKDFRIFDDDKEQDISSFTRVSKEAGADTTEQPRYIVLFFDNSSMNPADQIQARKAAAEFVEQATSKRRQMAIVDFGGVLHVAQNFTAAADALKRAVEGVKYGTLQSNQPGQPTEVATLGTPSLARIQSDFAARSVLLALRNLSKSLRNVPGRKTLILFSAGFPLTSERRPELTATIDAANKANIAIYPIDVRGLQGLTPPLTPEINNPRQPGFPGLPPGALWDESPFPHEPALWATLRGGLTLPQPLAQRPPTGGGGPGGGGGGPSPGGGPPGPGSGPGGSPPGGPGGGGGPGSGSPTRVGPGGTNIFDDPTRFGNNPPGSIIPPQLESVTTNQQILSALAAGTGGFTIFNTNDFKAGLEKIAKDLDDYYVLGYAPHNAAHDGSYHRIQVKVERKGVVLRARNGYYDVKSPDLLAGKPEGKMLEERAASSEPGEIPVSMAVPYFYTSPGVARVNVALQLPSSAIEFEKDKGKFHAQINVLGIAYRQDGSVAARFSDTVKNDLEKKDLKQLAKGPFAYQNTFNIAPGQYHLKVVLSAGGQKIGKVEAPLAVDPFDGKNFNLSGLALSREMHPVSQLAAQLDSALLEERTPLIVKGVELVPSPDNHFSRTEKIGLYCEVYEPEPIVNGFPRVGVIVDVYDRKTNQRVFTTNTILINDFIVQGNPIIPVGISVPLDRLQAGDFRLQVQARDSAGHASPVRMADFVLN